jgi:hypothetical protein
LTNRYLLKKTFGQGSSDFAVDLPVVIKDNARPWLACGHTHSRDRVY